MSERSFTEYDYGRLVALGLMRYAVRALVEARDLLESVEHHLAPDLHVAVREAAVCEQALMAEVADG